MYQPPSQASPLPALPWPCLRALAEAFVAGLPNPQSPQVIQHRQHGVITGHKVLVEDLQLHDILEGEQSKELQEGGVQREVSGTGSEGLGGDGGSGPGQ